MAKRTAALSLYLACCLSLGTAFDAAVEARSTRHKSTAAATTSTKTSSKKSQTHSTAGGRSSHGSTSSRVSHTSTSTSRHHSAVVVSRHGHSHVVAASHEPVKMIRKRDRRGRWILVPAPVSAHAKSAGHWHASAEPARAISTSQKSDKNSDVDDSQAQAQAAAEAQPRLRNYSLLGNAYALYDQGVNERLKGNYGLSTDKLTESSKLIDQASSIERDGRATTLQAMVFYELGLSAEADSELGLARDSFVHAVKAKPNYVEAYVHLVNVLATGGNLKQAANWLNDGLRECPNDGRLKALEKKLAGYTDSSALDDKE